MMTGDGDSWRFNRLHLLQLPSSLITSSLHPLFSPSILVELTKHFTPDKQKNLEFKIIMTSSLKSRNWENSGAARRTNVHAFITI